MLETDQTFYSTLRYVSTNRHEIMEQHQQNTSLMLAILQQYITADAPQRVFVTLGESWAEAVPIVPSAQQIAVGTTTNVSVTDTTCSICQEAMIVGTRLNRCQHAFHTECINQWFTRSPMCPMCRADIRETTPSATTRVQAPANTPTEAAV